MPPPPTSPTTIAPQAQPAKEHFKKSHKSKPFNRKFQVKDFFLTDRQLRAARLLCALCDYPLSNFVYGLDSLSALCAENLWLVAQIPHWQMGGSALPAMHWPGVRTTHSISRIIFLLCMGCSAVWLSRLSGFAVVPAGDACRLVNSGLFFRVCATDATTFSKRRSIL